MKHALQLFATLIFTLALSCAGSKTQTTGTAPAESSGLSLDQAISAAAQQIDSRVDAGAKIAIVNFTSPSDAFSMYVIDELTANLVESGKLAVIDRNEIDRIREEMLFQVSGEVDDNSIQELGRVLGAQFIVTGSYTNLGELHRIVIRALTVQTAAVVVQYRGNVVNDQVIAALLASGRTAQVAATTSATNNQTQPQTSQDASATIAQQPTSANIANGTYTFYPRPRAMQSGVDVDVYIDRIVVRGGYFNVYFVSTPVGRGNRPMGTQTSRWYHADATFGGSTKMIIQDLDNPRRTWNPINSGGDDESGGVFLSFQGVTAGRFTFSNSTFDSPVVFEEIILGEPDK